VLRKFFKFILVLLILGIVFGIYLLTIPEYRMQAKIFQKSIKIQAATAKLIADHTCSDELKKTECFDNFIRVTGGIEFSSDLALFGIGTYKVCYKNQYCMMAINDRMISQIDIKNFWVVTERQEDPAFFSEALKIEKGLVNRYLRTVRKSATDKFMTESDIQKKSDILNYIKTIDSKIIELSKSE
jgi:hypothetical protein